MALTFIDSYIKCIALESNQLRSVLLCSLLATNYSMIIFSLILLSVLSENIKKVEHQKIVMYGENVAR